jgi:hypothetical protein
MYIIAIALEHLSLEETRNGGLLDWIDVTTGRAVREYNDRLSSRHVCCMMIRDQGLVVCYCSRVCQIDASRAKARCGTMTIGHPRTCELVAVID